MNQQLQRMPEDLLVKEADLIEPTFYHVVLLNDDYTPMDFVVEILINIFHHSPADANRIMMLVHERNRGIAGTYPYEIASEKVSQVKSCAMQAEHPLVCVLEEV